jgi:hypothetical protein
MTNRPLTEQEIDDGWCLEEAPAPPPREDAPYEDYLLESAPPSSGFEQAYWEQVEGRAIARGFGEVSPLFGAPRLA